MGFVNRMLHCRAKTGLTGRYCRGGIGDVQVRIVLRILTNGRDPQGEELFKEMVKDSCFDVEKRQ